MKDMPVVESEKMKPCLSIDSDNIDNIEDFELESTVTVTATGKIVSLDSNSYGKKQHQSMRIEFTDIQVKEGKANEDEPGKKSAGKQSMADLLSEKMNK